MKRSLLCLFTALFSVFFLSACLVGPAGCVNNADCAGGSVCQANGLCAVITSLVCDDDGDCPNGTVCDEPVGHCIDA